MILTIIVTLFITIAIIVLGIAFGVLFIVIADLITYINSRYTGGHAAGRVHHNKSWED